MSHFTTVQNPKIKDRACLVQALCDLGIPRDIIEVHDDPKAILDYKGKTSYSRWRDHRDPRFRTGDKAHVVISRCHIGDLHNDVGWYLDENGAVAFICDFARDRCKALKGKKMDKKFEGRLLQEYVKNQILKTAKSRGQKTQVKRVGSEIKVIVG
jgi:hypothetical protein